MMLDMNCTEDIALDAVAWPEVSILFVDRMVWERWTRYRKDGEPAKGAKLLEEGCRYAAMVVYGDETWHSVGWSDDQQEIQIFAFNLAKERGLDLEYSPWMIESLRTLMN